MHIVLHQPEIPANTGNIGRTCVATGTSLHLIEPLGFRLDEKSLKRAGMDYWSQLDVHRHVNFAEFCESEGLVLGSGRLSTSVASEDSYKKYGGFLDEFVHNNSEKIDTDTVSPIRSRLWMATTKAKHCYTDVSFGLDDYIMFGRESAGIPEEILVEYEPTCIRIPMLDTIRSLNLSNSVAIVLYEALRQNGFEGMQSEGELHRLEWIN